jgi:membrane protein
MSADESLAAQQGSSPSTSPALPGTPQYQSTPVLGPSADPSHVSPDVSVLKPSADKAWEHNTGHIIWEHVSHSPLRSLWDTQGVSWKVIGKRTFKSFNDDNIISRAAELGYYFLFALFPTLVSASAILGLAARSATHIYVALLDYLTLVMPPSAYAMVVDTFNQTTQNSSGGKITFGLAAALWSASVGFSAIQDTMNTVYKVKETRPYWKARGSAILVTLLLSVVITLLLASLLGGDFAGKFAYLKIGYRPMQIAASYLIHTVTTIAAVGLLILLFSVIYYFAPDRKRKYWHWLTPGASVGILGWLIASFALRIYLHYFNSYSLTYGSLGAVIILLTWFYITGLMLLLGAEVNSEIEASTTERALKEKGVLPQAVTTDPDHPIK